MSKELKQIIEKIERESYQNQAVIYRTYNYDDELDPDCLRLSSHS